MHLCNLVLCTHRTHVFDTSRGTRLSTIIACSPETHLLYNALRNLVNSSIQINTIQYNSTQLSTTQQLKTTQHNSTQLKTTQQSLRTQHHGMAMRSRCLSLSLCNATDCNTTQRNALNTTVWRGEADVSRSISFSVLQSLVRLKLFVFPLFA